MTTRTVYVPVRIETPEQAETLPEGTIVRDSFDRVAIKEAPNTWTENDDTNGRRTDLGVVGWTALMPVDAEEEWGGSRPDGGAWQCQDRNHAESDADGWNRSVGPDGFQSTPVRRFATPWEEA